MPDFREEWDDVNVALTNEEAATESTVMPTTDLDTISYNLHFAAPDSKKIETSLPKKMQVLKPGKYTAEIVGVIKGVYEPRPGAKLRRCGMVTIIFSVSTESGDVSCRKVYYLVNEKWAADQLYYLFKAADLLHRDESFDTDWDQLVGRTVDITIRDNQVGGKIYHNNIVRVDPCEDLPF